MSAKRSFSSLLRILLAPCLLLFACAYNSAVSAADPPPPLTVQEVAKDLACPCQCPLILQDCNMSCGLRWKEEVGKKIAEGMSKQQVMDYFIGKYGESARLTPLQKVQGKIFQYTRGFGPIEWTILIAGIVIWLILMFVAIYVFVKRFSRKRRVS